MRTLRHINPENEMIEQAKHTPGPWTAARRASYFAVHCEQEAINKFGPRNIAIISITPFSKASSEGLANARLIAAAPELLEALREMVSELGGNGPVTARARAAIAKAEAPSQDSGQ